MTTFEKGIETNPPDHCPECGSIDKAVSNLPTTAVEPNKKCSHKWHKFLEDLGNAIGEAKFGG